MMLEYLAKQFVICIKIGYASIDDIRQDDLKETVIKLLAIEGLGPDGKPLTVEEPEEPVEEVKEPKDGTTEEVEEEEPVEEAKDEPKEPVEEDEEEEPSKDTKEEDKSPVEEDKGAK